MMAETRMNAMIPKYSGNKSLANIICFALTTIVKITFRTVVVTIPLPTDRVIDCVFLSVLIH